MDQNREQGTGLGDGSDVQLCFGVHALVGIEHFAVHENVKDVVDSLRYEEYPFSDACGVIQGRFVFPIIVLHGEKPLCRGAVHQLVCDALVYGEIVLQIARNLCRE